MQVAARVRGENHAFVSTVHRMERSANRWRWPLRGRADRSLAGGATSHNNAKALELKRLAAHRCSAREREALKRSTVPLVRGTLRFGAVPVETRWRCIRAARVSR